MTFRRGSSRVAILSISILIILLLSPAGSTRTPPGILLASPPLHGPSSPDDIMRFLPDDLLGAIFIHDADSTLRDLRDFLIEQGIEKNVFYQALSKDQNIEKFRLTLTGLAATAGSDLWSGIFALLGKEIAFGIKQGQGKEPWWIGVSITRNPGLLHKMLDALYQVAGLGALFQPNRKRIRMVGDVPVYSLNPKLFHCFVGDALIFSNHFEMISSSLGNDSRTGISLADSEAYRTARNRVEDHAAAWAYLDIAAVRRILPEETFPAPRISEPLAGFLFGGTLHQIIRGDRIVAWVHPRKGKLEINARMESSVPLPDSHRGFLVSPVESKKWSMQDLPRFIGGLSLKRGWADIFHERETLFSLPAAGKLVNFTSVLTTFMGGLDVMDDLLPRASGPVTFLAARRKYDDEAYETTPKLPAFAMAAQLDRDRLEDLGQRIRTAALMVFGLVNYQASEKREPAFLIDIESMQGFQIIQARYPPPEPDASGLVDMRYNFSPAISLAGDTLVIGSTGQVVRDLIELMNGDSTENGRGHAPVLEDCAVVEFTELKTILEENREELITGRMLDEGESKQEAEVFFDGLFEVMDRVGSLRLTSTTASRSSSYRLELCLKDGGKKEGTVR